MQKREQKNQQRENEKIPKTDGERPGRKSRRPNIKVPSGQSGRPPRVEGVDTNTMTPEEKRERNRKMVKEGAQSEYNHTQPLRDEQEEWRRRDQEIQEQGRRLAEELERIRRNGYKL